jgi:hypothetical protein
MSITTILIIASVILSIVGAVYVLIKNVGVEEIE